MVGVVHMHLHIGVRARKSLHAVHRNPVVVLAKMCQHRHLGLARHFVCRGHAAAVVARRRRQALEAAGRAPGQQASPAKTHNAHLAATLLRGVIDGSLDVGHGTGAGQCLHRRLEAKAHAHVGLAVAQVHIGLHARKGGGGHCQIATRRETVGHRTDVRIDPEDLLQHHHGATRRSVGLGHPGGHHKTVLRRQIDKLAHAIAP